MRPAAVAWRLAQVLPVYARLAWWGLAAPSLGERTPLVVVQAVVVTGDALLLTVRSDLRGWELPGGAPRPAEAEHEALVRELREETGLEVEPERMTGEYVRTGFRPHVARVWRCRVAGGALRPSPETPRVEWWPLSALPGTLFPWYRQPLADALTAASQPVRRREHQGLRAVLAGMSIDLRMRLSADGAGRAPR